MSEDSTSEVGDALAEPPPLPQVLYHVSINRQRRGPLSLDQLRQEPLTAQTLVWCKGMRDWAPAQSVPALSALLEELPPPLPPKSHKPNPTSADATPEQRSINATAWPARRSWGELRNLGYWQRFLNWSVLLILLSCPIFIVTGNFGALIFGLVIVALEGVIFFNTARALGWSPWSWCPIAAVPIVQFIGLIILIQASSDRMGEACLRTGFMGTKVPELPPPMVAHLFDVQPMSFDPNTSRRRKLESVLAGFLSAGVCWMFWLVIATAGSEK